MFRGDPRHTGQSPYDTSHVDGTVKWTFTPEDLFKSSPSFGSSPSIGPDGTIYIGSHKNNVYVINPDGTEKWLFDAGDPVYNKRYDIWNGILSSPAIASDGTIYIRSLSNFLFAINPDGTEKWRFPVKVSTNTWSSPTIGTDGTIYIGSARKYSEGKVKTEIGGKIYAINPDGTEKWRFETESDVFPSPTIGDDGTIYCGAGATGKLYAINPDGTKKWHFQTGLHIESTAAIGSDGTIYFGSWDNNVYAINPDGTEKWHFSTQGGGIVSSPAIGTDGTIYIVANDNNLYAINSHGIEKWRFLLGKAKESASSPTIGADGTIYVGFHWTDIGIPTFFAVNPDGTEKWSFVTRGGVTASPAIDKDGTVYISSHDGGVYAFSGPPAD